MRRSTSAVLVLAAGLALNLPTTAAFAADTTGNMPVSATVEKYASVTTTNLAFGSYTGTRVDGTASIRVTATNGTAYTVAISAGTGAGASTNNRKMTNSTSSTNTLSYGLFKDSGRTTVWGDTAGSMVTSTGTGNEQTLQVFGSIPAGQTPTVGAYTDALVATVTY